VPAQVVSRSPPRSGCRLPASHDGGTADPGGCDELEVGGRHRLINRLLPVLLAAVWRRRFRRDLAGALLGRLRLDTYRLLGSVVEAEDVVQEAYARWHALAREQQEAIEAPGAWLTTVTSRVCLDLLGSARARRERYVGEWIPEPLPERGEWGDALGAVADDPADRVSRT